MTRTEAPHQHLIDRLDIQNFEHRKLKNGTDLYFVGGIEEDLIRVELRFKAGRWYEPRHVVSRAVSNIMKKGTSTKNAKQIAVVVDFYGAQLEIEHGHDLTSIIIFCLGKYLDKILPVAEEIMTDASFAEDELEHFVKKQKQKLLISAQNTDFHANRKFNEVIFGKDHPYGYATFENDFNALNSSLLKDYHRKHYNPADATIFMAGNVNENAIALVEKHFGHYQKNGVIISSTDKNISTDFENKFFIAKEDSVQSSVRIGNISISKKHPDYPEFNVLNTAFGGYFGSRLMTNIREDKGYTYGIHSGVTHYKYGSFFVIQTETGNEVCAAAIAETYKEMDILKKEKMDADELMIIKNYMMGGLLRATDGPFNRINVIKNMVMSDLDTSYFDSLVSGIKNITADRLMELANTYLDQENMKEVVCGKK